MTATTIEHTEIPSTLPPVDCAPWCRDGDGHTESWHHDDQACWTDLEAVPLSRRLMVKMGDNTRRLDSLELCLRREGDARTTLVLINDETHALETPLTVAEARQLAATLTRFADLAEGVRA